MSSSLPSLPSPCGAPNFPCTPQGVPSPRLRPLSPFSALLSADPSLLLPPHLDLFSNAHSTVLDSLHLDALPPARLPLLVFVNKGIETGTNKLPLEVIEEACGKEVAHVSTFLVSRVPYALESQEG